MPDRRWKLLSVAVLLLAAPAGASGQATVSRIVIGDRPTCPNCRINLSERARVAIRDVPIVPLAGAISRDSKGKIYVVSRKSPGEIVVYDANGNFAGRLTREGAGPGEARGVPRVVITADDTVHVFDSLNARHTVFTSDHQLVRETRFPFRNYDVFPQDATHFVFAAPQASEGKWSTLHLRTTRGEAIRSFAPPESDQNAEVLLWRRICRSNDGAIWSAQSYGDYRIELWKTTGDLMRVVSRTAPWFRSTNLKTPPELQRNESPPPAVVALREDAARRIWVLLAVPKRDWKRAYAFADPPAWFVYDSLLEVIDLSSGVLLARQTIPSHLLGFLGDDLIGYEENSRGLPIITFWKVQLEGVR